MDGLLSIISNATSLNNNQYPTFITALQIHQSFSKKVTHELDPTISLISNYLNNVKLRHEGLLLLKSLLLQCPLEVIEQKGSLWVTLCTKICVQEKNSVTVNIAYDVICNILEKSIHIPELNKTIASSLLSKIVESLNAITDECHYEGLKCLEVCMSLYPGPCGSSRIHIERFLSNFIDDINPKMVRQAAKCLLLLQQVRGGSVHGLSQKCAWSLLQTRLILSLHKILNQYFSNTVESFDDVNHNSMDSGTHNIKLPELNLSADPVARTSQLSIRFSNLCHYLRVALSEPFPAPKSIQGAKILTLVSRGLAINSSTLARNAIVDNIALGGLLPELHVALYQLLNTLILVLGTHLLPYATNICQLGLQTLKWTSFGKANGFTRPYSKLREMAYKTINLWCKTTKYGSLAETIADDLIKHILQDITPFEAEVTLKVSAGSRKYLSNKARQRLQKVQNDATNLAQTHSKSFNPANSKVIYSDKGNEKLCAEALGCLNQLILSSGCFLKPILQKILQENIISLSIKTASAVALKSNLYYNTECRANLYSVLYSLTISPHHLCPPPIQFASTIFSVVQNSDINIAIREECATCLRSIEKILHPQKEVFYLPTGAADFWKNIGEKDCSISSEVCNSEEEENIELEIDVRVEEGNNGTSQRTVDEEPSLNKQIIDIDDVLNIQETSSVTITISDEVEETNEICEIQPQLKLTNPAEASASVTSESPIQKRKEIEEDEAIVLQTLSPPRKSLRLSLAQSSGGNSGSDQENLDKPEVPRRRSARLNSSSSQSTPKKSDDNTTPNESSNRIGKLEKIQESDENIRKQKDNIEDNVQNDQEVKEQKIDEEKTAIGLNSKTDEESVNQMFSEFVDEFLVDETEPANDSSD